MAVAAPVHRYYCAKTGGRRGLSLKRHYSDTSDEEEEDEVEIETGSWCR